MSACRQGRQWQKALEIFRVDVDDGAVDASLLGIAIACAATGHLWTFALDILASSHHYGVVPTAAAENAGILACEKGRQWEMALSIFAKMQRREKISMTTVNSVLSACEKARQWRHALSLLQILPSLKLQPNRSNSSRVISVNLAIGAFAAGRHWQQAMDCFHQLCRSNEASHTSHTTTLSSCERAMRWEDALTLLWAWPFNSQSSEVASIAAARAGRWQEALSLVQGHFGRQQLIQSCEQSGCWGRSVQPNIEHSARLVETLHRWKVELPKTGEVALRGVGKHLAILMHPGTAPSNAIWCLTARDWQEASGIALRSLEQW
ncbi:unnamed protein product [Cladocopium goreaui]|nr:unnamed protein product [Cladocopium goreaui]